MSCTVVDMVRNAADLVGKEEKVFIPESEQSKAVRFWFTIYLVTIALYLGS